MLQRSLTKAFLALAVTTSSIQAQNIVQNGGFETPVAPRGGWTTYSAGSTFGNWTVGSGSIDLVSTYWTAAGGIQSVDMSGSQDGSIFQDLVTSPRRRYNLSFAMAGNPYGGPASKTMEVFWGALNLGTFTFDITGRSASNMGWQIFNLSNLRATSGTTRLTFQSTTPGVFGPALDQVSVLVRNPPSSTVPEPMSMALLGTGLAGVAAVRRRRRKEPE